MGGALGSVGRAHRSDRLTRKLRGQAVIELSQDRFLSLAPRKKPSDPTRWTIPWVGRVGQAERGESLEVRRLLSKQRERIPSQGAEFSWIYGNAGETGFFRVDHGRAEHEDLLANLASLSRVERIGLVGHRWALAQAGRVPIESLLELLARFGGVEEDPDVLAAVEAVLLRLCRRLAPSAGPQVEAQLRSWIGSRFGNDLDRVGPSPMPREDESELPRRARMLSIIGGLAQTDEVVRECEGLCAQHFTQGTPLEPELAAEIIQIAARRAGPTLHAALRAATREAKTPQARRRYYFALAEFSRADLIEASVGAALDGELAPAPDRAGLIALLLARPQTAMPTWIRLQKVWKRLEREMPPILLARLAGATAEALPTREAAAIRAFFARHPLAAGSRVLSQIAEQLEIARRFERSAGPALTAYLSG
ncbi:MAG: ERAP1-like C-terminal domain-containing protein [Deltaproteobacteria bacterium]|nr:ERAP1-like C-terminal domain-containing protein [Deltaproteobacteria bacterium]